MTTEERLQQPNVNSGTPPLPVLVGPPVLDDADLRRRVKIAIYISVAGFFVPFIAMAALVSASVPVGRIYLFVSAIFPMAQVVSLVFGGTAWRHPRGRVGVIMPVLFLLACACIASILL